MLETINEFTVLWVIYLLMCFTEFVPDPNTRHELGPVYIGLSGGNFALHLILILLTTLNNLRKTLTKKCINCIAKRKM